MSDTSPLTQDSTRKIVIPADVYVQLEQIRRSGVTNMTDCRAVQFYANRHNAPNTVCWLEENRETYFRGFFQGFAPDRALTEDEQDAIEAASETGGAL